MKKTFVRWFGGRSGHWTSLDGHWCIARLQYRRPARYLVIETSDRYFPHPDFATLEAAKAFVDTRDGVESGRLVVSCPHADDPNPAPHCPHTPDAPCDICDQDDDNQPPADSDREPDDSPWER